MDDQNSARPQRIAEPEPAPKRASGLGQPLSRTAIALEYASLGLSVAGTVSAFISKQAAYAAAPISVSLFLSLLNRQRLNQQLAQQARLSAQQAQVLNQLGEGVEPLQEKVAGLQREVEAQAQIERDRPNFFGQIQSLQSALTGLASQAQLEQLQAEFSAQLTPLTQQLAEEAKAVALQRQALEALNQQLFQEKARLAELETRLSEVEQIERDRPDLAQDFALQIEQLRDAMAERFQRFQQLLEGVFPRTDAEQFQAELAQQVQRTHGLANQLNQLQAKLSRYLQDHESAHQTSSAVSLSQVEELAQRLSWLEEQVTGGTDSGKPDPEPEVATLFLNLGIDFGTRFTKVCFQNLSDEQSEVIPFRAQTENLSDALLLSQIGILPDGQLLAGLSESQWQELQLPNLKVIDGLKMRLADLDLGNTQTGWRLEAFPELDEPEMVENLSAYYLSRVIQKSQAWVREHRPQLVANEIIGWSANVGVPVAYCDDQPVSDRFKRVLTLAWRLSNEPQTQVLTLQLLQKQMTRLRKQLNQAVNCHAVPEIGAESWSFLNSREAKEGYYLFFDIGDGTIDGCAFNYERLDGEPQVEFYYSQVQPLGVRSLSQSLATELQLTDDQAAALLLTQHQDPRLVNSPQCKRVLQMLSQVIMRGGKTYAAHHPSDKDYTYSEKLTIFLGGGGSQFPFFLQLPAQAHQTLSHRNYGIVGYDVQRLPAPPQLQMNGLNAQDFHRFAVAFGLATDYANLSPALHLPKQVAENAPMAISSQSSGGDVTAYEDSKDAY